MVFSRVVLMVFIMGVMIVHCLATSENCGINERSNADSGCQVTCNACRDCGPCLCKSGYIRSALGGDCITESTCHELHMKWIHDAKYEDKKDKFFNCST